MTLSERVWWLRFAGYCVVLRADLRLATNSVN